MSQNLQDELAVESLQGVPVPGSLWECLSDGFIYEVQGVSFDIVGRSLSVIYTKYGDEDPPFYWACPLDEWRGPAAPRFSEIDG